MDIHIKSKQLAKSLLVLAVCINLANLADQLADYYFGRNLGLSIFDPDKQLSLSRFYSVILLLLCSSLFLILAGANKVGKDNRSGYWSGLAIIFFIFAISKSTGVHDILAMLFRFTLNISKINFYAWLYIILSISFLAIYRNFFRILPKKVFRLFFLGGIVFLIGAFGIDLILAYTKILSDHLTLAIISLATLEEFLEMSGGVIIIYSLLMILSSESEYLQVTFVE